MPGRGLAIAEKWDADEREWLHEFVKAVKDDHADAVADVLIYGSKARGDWHEASDIDVLVIVADGKEIRAAAVHDLAYDLSNERDALPVLMTMTVSEWQDLDRNEPAFHRAVRRDGVSVLRTGAESE